MKCKYCGHYIHFDGRYMIYVHNKDGLATCMLDRRDSRFMMISATPEDD